MINFLTNYERERLEKIDAKIKYLLDPFISEDVKRAVKLLKEEKRRIKHRAANRKHRAE
jgi:hypothetical protein